MERFFVINVINPIIAKTPETTRIINDKRTQLMTVNNSTGPSERLVSDRDAIEADRVIAKLSFVTF